MTTKMPLVALFAALSFALLSAGSMADHDGGGGDVLLPPPLKDRDYLYDGAPPPALFELGRSLFFDPILSGNRNISCGTCHDPAFGSGDGLALGIGEGGHGAGPARFTVDAVTGRVPRNAQPLWNIGARDYTVMFHDGRVEMFGDAIPAIRSPAGRDLPEAVSNALVAQAFFPVTSPIEMAGQFGENPIATAAHHEDRSAIWAKLAERIAANPGYLDMLKVAFPKIATADQVTYQHIAEALAAFQTLAFRSDNSPFDAALRRRDISVLPVAAQRGLHLFYGKARCSACHSGPLLTDHKFRAIAVPQIGPGKGHGSDMSYLHQTGLPGRAEDEGRYRITNDPSDLFAFRTPSLRNVALTGPWGHSGAFDRLEDMVRHHLDPRASLAAFDPAKVRLPQLDHIQHLSARGSDLRFAPLEASRRAAFELRDNWVMTNAQLRQRIADANDLAPVSLTATEITEIVAFLESLTDSSSADRSDLIPTRVPSGLQPQPSALKPKKGGIGTEG